MDKYDHDKLYREILGQDISYYEILKREIFNHRPRYYNRRSEPVTEEEFKLLSVNPKYTIVCDEDVEPYRITTYWIGEYTQDCLFGIRIMHVSTERIRIMNSLISGEEEDVMHSHNMLVFYADQNCLDEFIRSQNDHV